MIIEQDDGPLMMKVFNENPKEVMSHIAQSATCPGGTPFGSKTKKSLEGAQRYLSAGSVSVYRNPLSHETHNVLSAGRGNIRAALPGCPEPTISVVYKVRFYSI